MDRGGFTNLTKRFHNFFLQPAVWVKFTPLKLGDAMKILWWSLAAVLILLGLATVWLPIPTGVPLLALGLIVVVGTSRSAARHLRKHRRNTPPLNSVITWVENRSPLRFARILKRTRPRKKDIHHTPETRT